MCIHALTSTHMFVCTYMDYMGGRAVMDKFEVGAPLLSTMGCRETSQRTVLPCSSLCTCIQASQVFLELKASAQGQEQRILEVK